MNFEREGGGELGDQRRGGGEQGFEMAEFIKGGSAAASVTIGTLLSSKGEK